MSDNVDITPGSGKKVASDEVTYSGDTANVQLVRVVHVVGAEGSKTVATPQFAKISASSSGDNTIVAAVSGKKIRVLAFALMASAAVNAKFQSDGGTDTDLTGLLYFAAAGAGISVPYSQLGLFETVAGEALLLELSAAVAVGGFLVYIEI